MLKKIFARPLLATVLSVTMAATVGVVGGVVTSTMLPQAAAAGNPGGKITLATVMGRAQWWMNTYGVVYSQNQGNAKADGDGEKYRPDCSGFISMAWHLTKTDGVNDRWTGNLASFGDTTWVGLSSLLRGDAILGVSYGHVALFDKWTDSSHTRMYVYEEYGTGLEGRYTIKDKSWYSANGFSGLRYNKIVSDTWGVPTGLWCQYKVYAPSGAMNQRSGPGNTFTVEGYFYNGEYVWGAQDATVSANGLVYRRFSGGRLPGTSGILFVASGDGATMGRVSGCF